MIGPETRERLSEIRQKTLMLPASRQRSDTLFVFCVLDELMKPFWRRVWEKAICAIPWRLW